MRISDWSSDVCSSDLPEAVCKTAGGGRDRPDRHTGIDHPAPVVTIRERAGKQTDDRECDRERGAVENAELQIGKAEITLDGIDHQADDEAIEHREPIQQREHHRRVPADRGARIRRHARWRGGYGSTHPDSSYS